MKTQEGLGLALLESRKRFLLLLIHLKQIQQSDHLEGLQSKFCRIQKLQIPTLLLGVRKVADQ